MLYALLQCVSIYDLRLFAISVAVNPFNDFTNSSMHRSAVTAFATPGCSGFKAFASTAIVLPRFLALLPLLTGVKPRFSLTRLNFTAGAAAAAAIPILPVPILKPLRPGGTASASYATPSVFPVFDRGFVLRNSVFTIAHNLQRGMLRQNLLRVRSSGHCQLCHIHDFIRRAENPW